MRLTYSAKRERSTAKAALRVIPGVLNTNLHPFAGSDGGDDLRLGDEASPGVAASVARVAFSPGARTAWHTHPFGQILVVVSGVGLVCKGGETALRLRAGDSVAIAPGERHWHGATPDLAFTH